MANFDPDTYLATPPAEKPAFDPDAYLQKGATASMPMGEVASEAASNAPESLYNVGAGLVHSVAHPFETAKNLWGLYSGLGQKQQSMYAEALGKPMPEGPNEKYANAMGAYLSDRYGGIENVKRAFAKDPAGVLADLSLPLTGMGSVAARLPGVAGRVGEIAATTGRVLDPVNDAAWLAKKASGPLKGFAAIQSGAGKPALEEAYGAGLAGGPQQERFQAHLTGAAPLSDVVDQARAGVNAMKVERSEAYNREMDQLRLSENQFDERDRILDFNNIDHAIQTAEEIQTFRGRHGSGPAQILDPGANGIREEMIDHVNRWRQLPAADYHTAEGLDALKKQLWNDMRGAQPGTPARAAAQRIYNAVKGTIESYYPRYTEIMGNYQEASRELDEVTRALSLGDKATVDTSLRKLQSLLRNNVTSSFAHRAQLGERLQEAGAPNLRASLAGQALNTSEPRGLAKHALQNVGPAIAGALGYGAHQGLGAAAGMAATIPFMFPRVVGEGAFRAGQARRLLGPYLERARDVPMGLRDITAGTTPQQKRGGRIDSLIGPTIRRIKKQGGGELDPGESWQPGQDEKPTPELPSVGEPLIPSGGQFSPGVGWVNKAADVDSRFVGQMVQGAAQDIMAPGLAMKPNPYEPGTEEHSWYEDQREQAGLDWGRRMALNTMGTGAIAGVPARGAEAVLGAGLTRRTGQGTEAAYKGAEGASDATEAVQAAAADKAARDVPQGVVGPSGGGEGLREAQLRAEQRAAGRAPLPGLPTQEQIVDGELFRPGPVARAHEVAEQYMADKDFGLAPPEKYHELDPVHARAIAKAYDKVKHDPNDPKVKASYDALIKETLAQYRAIKESGLEITPTGVEDYPYHGNPRAVVKDVADNNHMAFFRTRDGFGSAADTSGHPMLKESGETLNGEPLLNNDLFRIVHDYFGHVKNGYGFRAAGEDNAWRAHAAMYSPQARPAMTTETRGQNSWLNYGPHGDKNRTANAQDTVYAQQKAGLMPAWTMRDRGGYYEGEAGNAGVTAPTNKKIQTVADPYRMMYPGIYGNPINIAKEAAARVGPEDINMKRLFGVTRDDLYQTGKGRVGNEPPNLQTAGNPRGSLSAQNIQTPQNTQRLIDILAEARRYPGLRNSTGWYVMDPVYQRLEQLFGPKEAVERYKRFNTMTGMASPGSDVETEVARGTAAHWLNQQGRFGDFAKYAGVPAEARTTMRGFPEDMLAIPGHPYHRTSQAGPMEKYLAHGSIQSADPKVPLYTHASGVPETGFQTTGPVGDAHFSRGVGMSDTRKGPTDVQGSFSRSEYQTLQPWWQHKVAGKVGLESVPAQAQLWTTLGPQTGVESALGAPKLELLTKQIMKASRRLGISPEKARDLVLSGEAGAFRVGGTAPSYARGGRVSVRDLIAPTIARGKGSGQRQSPSAL